MISLLTMIVVMMIAFTSNVGQLVTEKIALQNTADFAAYSGAATQAGVLNDIRRHNQNIWQAHKTARQILQMSETTPWPDYAKNKCPVCVPSFTLSCPGGGSTMTNAPAEAARNAVKAVLQFEEPYIKGKNNLMPQLALSAAQSSVSRNYQSAQMTTKGGSMEKADLDQDKIDLDYYAWGIVTFPTYCVFNGQPVGFLQINHQQQNSWFFKKPGASGEVMFAVETRGTPATSFLGSDGGTYLGNYFGDRQELKAYAAALPMAGKVGAIKGGQFSNAKERNSEWQCGSGSCMNNTQTGPFQVDRANVLEGAKIRGGSFEDYRVRYVGIFETAAQFPNGNDLTGSFPSNGVVAH